MTGTVEFIQIIRYVEIPDEKGEMQVYAIPEDTRELVRCKDCKKQGSYDCHITSLTGQKSSDDWFCADGMHK